MTDSGSPKHDPLWNEALTWLLRLNARPDDPKIKASFETWLEADAGHARAFAEAEAVWTLTGQVPAAELSRPSASNPRRSLNPGAARNAANLTRRRWRIRIGGALAAALVLAALLPGWWVMLRADYRTAVGEIRAVTLADGSRVTLNTDSALRVTYTRDERQVELLEGEAFFDVMRDPARLFEVRAGGARARVIGTRFNVRRTEDEFFIAVSSGTVRTTPPIKSANAQRLIRGQALKANLDSGKLTLLNVNPDHIAAWRRGRLVVQARGIGSVLEEIRRYHSGVIINVSPALGRKPVSGIYDVDDPLRALKAVVAPYAGRVRAFTPYLIVVSAG